MNIIEQNTLIPFTPAELIKNKFVPIALFDKDGNYYTLVGKDKIYKTNKNIFVESVKVIFNSQAKAKFSKSISSMPKAHYKEMERILKEIPYFSQSRYLMEVGTLQKSFLFKQYNEINFLLQKEIINLKKSHFEYMAAPALARQKAYGKTNVNDALFEKYGVKIKKQDGSNFSQTEINEATDIVSAIFDFLKIPKSLVANNKLVISFTHNKSMKSARNAAGVFVPNYKSIGVSFSDGYNGNIAQSKIVLAHEMGHWLDYVLGKVAMNFASSTAGTIQNLLATTFLQNMNNLTKAGSYWKNGTECFARAIEEYVAIEIFNHKSYFTKSFYCNQKIYEEKIKPLIKLIVANLQCM